MVDLTIDVTRQVAELDFDDHLAWETCLSEIAADPMPRFAAYVDRLLLPIRTYVYEIAEQLSISNERFMAFSAEFFPDYEILYTVDESARTVTVFYLRSPNPRYG